MNHDRHHSLVVDAIEAAISGSPKEKFLRAWFNKFRRSKIKEEDAEAELYKSQHSKGTGKQDLSFGLTKGEVRPLSIDQAQAEWKLINEGRYHTRQMWAMIVQSRSQTA